MEKYARSSRRNSSCSGVYPIRIRCILTAQAT
ncbi:hypothetical protein MSMEG_5905 [Mycolicibacterium smegmatis MC2 155]|uniref:Uncharacterized protein n=1 Tax=Mycolicibacterium smegmatis (strain ATCC 700084 / mc(2)155) TaxID=246196 RepID=A0R4P3_MYCS2|nr:hypothetical protein MSMEG_5905 [Mycolicibacterium smegmatis MC2 155]